MNKWYLKSGLAALLGGVTLIALAADPVAVLQQPQGKVFISQGKAMAPAQPGIAVYPGTRVVTAASSGVSVVYTDGCKVILPENSLLVLGGPKQCKAGLAQVRTIGSFQNARIGQGGEVLGGLGAGAWVIGGAAIIAVGAAIANDNNNDNRPASPF